MRFLLNLHGQRRPIFFSRHGQSEYNRLKKIGHSAPFFFFLKKKQPTMWDRKFLADLNDMPIPSMYGIFTYIYHKNQLNVCKYTIHGWYGIDIYQISIRLVLRNEKNEWIRWGWSTGPTRQNSGLFGIQLGYFTGDQKMGSWRVPCSKLLQSWGEVIQKPLPNNFGRW